VCRALGSAKSAEDIFTEVWNDIGFQEYFDTLQKEINVAATDVIEYGKWDSTYELAKNRKGLSQYIPNTHHARVS